MNEKIVVNADTLVPLANAARTATGVEGALSANEAITLATGIVESGGGGGGNADWNAAEGEPGHVLNRTHYVETGAVQFVPDIAGTPNENGSFALQTPCTYFPNNGDIFTVTYNGNDYDCVAEVQGLYGITVVTLAAKNEDAVEVVFVCLTDAAGAAVVGSAGEVTVKDGATSVTMSIKHHKDVYHKLDRQFIPALDWNAAEGEPGHILNRTHYAEDKSKNILAKTELLEEDQIGDDGYWLAMCMTPLVAGNTYIVEWNGKEYECVAFTLEGTVVLCDASLSADEEPSVFAIQDVGSGYYFEVRPFDGSTNFTVSVREKNEVVHKLDPKYLPGVIPGDEEYTDVLIPEFSGTVDEKNQIEIPSHNTFPTKIRPYVYQGQEIPNCYYGGTATVVFNGNEYQRDIIVLSIDTEEMAVIGKMDNVFNATDPFSIIIYGGDYAILGGSVEVFDGSQNVTLSSMITGIHIRHLDEKYIPDTISRAANLMNGIGEGSIQFSRATATGNDAVALNFLTKAKGHQSTAIGYDTIASGDKSFVYGTYNVEDTSSKYVSIVGNGAGYDSATQEYKRSNAHTLDWDGNAWFAGSVEGTALILKSPNGTRYQITVDDSGALTATAAT